MRIVTYEVTPLEVSEFELSTILNAKDTIEDIVRIMHDSESDKIRIEYKDPYSCIGEMTYEDLDRLRLQLYFFKAAVSFTLIKNE